MRGTRAKALMKMVRWERAAEMKVVERDLVIDKRGVVRHSPDSIRMLYLKIKAAFTGAIRKIGHRVQFDPTLREDALERAIKRANGPQVKARARKELVPQLRTPLKTGGIALIQKPLRVIAGHCPPTEVRSPGPAGEVIDWTPHPTLVYARRLANAGNGAAVQAIARALSVAA